MHRYLHMYVYVSFESIHSLDRLCAHPHPSGILARMSLTIGLSGAVGSFSEEAAKHYAKIVGENTVEYSYLVSVAQVLEMLTSGSVERGIFPIENSNGGIVIEAVHAMATYTFAIERMFEIDVHHNLLVTKGTNSDDITTITSHDQALKQCRMYLKRRWPGIELVEYVDTAKAAVDLGKGVLQKNTAVIAPKACAELYGLELLEESIQDLKFNYTTFVAAVRA
jgi:prephenate dehydratase